MLASEVLASRITKCEILSAETLPPKWSDHAGILVEIEAGGDDSKVGEAVSPAMPLCKEWVKLHRRFNDPAQRSILDMFGGAAKKRKEGEGRGAEGPAESKRGRTK